MSLSLRKASVAVPHHKSPASDGEGSSGRRRCCLRAGASGVSQTESPIQSWFWDPCMTSATFPCSWDTQCHTLWHSVSFLHPKTQNKFKTSVLPFDSASPIPTRFSNSFMQIFDRNQTRYMHSTELYSRDSWATSHRELHTVIFSSHKAKCYRKQYHKVPHTS